MDDEYLLENMLDPFKEASRNRNLTKAFTCFDNDMPPLLPMSSTPDSLVNASIIVSRVCVCVCVCVYERERERERERLNVIFYIIL